MTPYHQSDDPTASDGGGVAAANAEEEDQQQQQLGADISLPSPARVLDSSAMNVTSPSDSPADLDHADGPDSAAAAAAAAARNGSNDDAETASPASSTAGDDDAGQEYPNDDDYSSDKPLKVLFLSSDTGGGHRASAESLARQFELLYPGSTYDLLDVVASDGVPPYNSLVSWYSHLGSHPTQWKLVYNVSNSKAFELMADVHLKLMCERAVRRRIMSYSPDVVVSVHPLMCNVPALACQKIEKKTGRHLPMFTVVTDLGSAHCLWFANKIDRMYIASDAVANLAKSRGKVPDEKLVKIGLPIRHDFAVQSEALGDRFSDEGREYQVKVRTELGLPHDDRRTILVMGGGEGVGSLSDIVNYLYVVLLTRGIDAQVLVVCGRNDKLKADLETRDWDNVLVNYKRLRESGPKVLSTLAFDGCLYNKGGGGGATAQAGVGCIETSVTAQIRRILSSSTLENALTTSLPASAAPSAAPSAAASEAGEGSEDDGVGMEVEEGKEEDAFLGDEDAAAEAGKEGEESEVAVKESAAAAAPAPAMPTTPSHAISEDAEIPGKVAVLGLGFVTRMAEYMVASDVLVSKAGPGTIAEAASLSLPVMLTSFLPGQEEGNVDFVVDNKFGAFCSDADPTGIAEQVASWLLEEDKLKELSGAARECGAPNAAADIIKDIGEETLRWRKVNSQRAAEEAVKIAEAKAAKDAADLAGETTRGRRQIEASIKSLYTTLHSNLSSSDLPAKK